MAILSRERFAGLVAATAAEWRAAARAWSNARRVVLYDAARELLTRTVCEWAGVPLPPSETWLRCRDLTALFDGAGAVGPRHWAAQLARKRSEHWLAQWVAAVRRGDVDVPDTSAARLLADHRKLGGARLNARTAAVELLNVLRPTVAVAVYVTFCAHALHAHPEWRRRIAAGEFQWLDPFVHEVRRFYPFFPAVTARVRRDFDWRGMRFQAGRRALLDLYGTSRDPRTWSAPDEFRPDRFVEHTPAAFELIPQGGGDPFVQHRCAGEALTIELMKTAVRALCCEFDYTVPQQDLAIDFARLPALPKSRFVITDVRPR
jgi:fatty-acid peroxygenase